MERVCKEESRNNLGNGAQGGGQEQPWKRRAGRRAGIALETTCRKDSRNTLETMRRKELGSPLEMMEWRKNLWKTKTDTTSR